MITDLSLNVENSTDINDTYLFKHLSSLSDFSIFAAAMVKIQGPDEDQLAVEGKTNNTQTDQAAKVKGEMDLDNDWSESDSETAEITADFEIDEETDQPATCGGKKTVSGITMRSADLV